VFSLTSEEKERKKIFLFQTSMAFSSSIFSVTQFSSSLASRPSSAISRQTRFPAQIASPDLSPALFDDRRKFVGGVMSLLTKSIKNRVYASINSIDSAATPSYPVSNLFQSFFVSSDVSWIY
jgi:hypothetical protein